MKPRDTRKSIAAAKELCKKHGIAFELIKEKGKGSHQALLFKDITTNESVKIVIAGGDQISPGVQRGILKYLREVSRAVKVAEVVCEIWSIVFGGH
jgi:hypothetical protein